MWLNKYSETALKTYLPVLSIQENYDKFNTAHLIGWLLFGTLYCYIASYPILVLHAIRVRLFKNREESAVNSLVVRPISLFAVLVSISAWLAYFHIECAAILMAFSVILFSCYQIRGLHQVSSLKNKKDNQENGFSYADKLAKARKQEEEFIDSYKHLREHGNAALIILLEILLAAVLYVAFRFENQNKLMNFSMVAIVLFIWVAPAALVYFYGHYLEKRLSDFYPHQNNKSLKPSEKTDKP